MENVRLLNNSVLLEDNGEDYISETLNEESNAMQNDIKKRKLTLIGLGTFYILLLLASFTFLT